MSTNPDAPFYYVSSYFSEKRKKTVRCCFCLKSHERRNCVLVPSDGSNWNKWISVFGTKFELECSKKVENYIGKEHLGMIEKYRLKNCEDSCVSVILDHDYLKWKNYHVKDPSYYFELEPSAKRQKVENQQVPELKMDHDYFKLEDYRKVRDGVPCSSSTYFTNRNRLKNCDDLCVSVILDHDYVKVENYNLKKSLIRKLEKQNCQEISEEDSSSTAKKCEEPPVLGKYATVVLDHDYLKLKHYHLKAAQIRKMISEDEENPKEESEFRKPENPPPKVSTEDSVTVSFQKRKPDEKTILKDHDYSSFEDFMRDSGELKDSELNKILCSISSILKITRVCYECVQPAKYDIIFEKGVVTVNMKCQKCGKRWKWCSTDN